MRLSCQRTRSNCQISEDGNVGYWRLSRYDAMLAVMSFNMLRLSQRFVAQRRRRLAGHAQTNSLHILRTIPAMPLKLYANFISQPSRAVAWLLAVKNVDYELVRMDFGSPLFKSEEFLAMNPNGFIPVIKDEDFTLFESNAILTYLADKYGWEDVYPKDLQTRAKINEYLHWHHTTVREFTNRILDPFISKALGSASDEDREHVKNAPKLIAKYTSILEKFFATDLDFVARTSEPSVADYALYCEYDQLDSMGLLNLAAFPKTTAWLERMKKVSKHDELREEMNGAFWKRGIYAHV